MWRDPIRIVPKRPGDIFDPRSRINLGKTYRIHKGESKVKEIGYVDEESLPKLLDYRKEISDRWKNVFGKPGSSTKEGQYR